jgi:hypothetical protein
LSKGNQMFKETDVKRALRAARKELSDFTLRITRDAICIETRGTAPPDMETRPNTFDKVLGD